ncbi:MAG: filamentous hemagglutinin N-terminal domain-containing protein [Verrucomicrobiota bacterium]|nr:filamentous hemagglutinin N-terminal domain-containing protein [Verrucomicrobiota bacterium]
MKRCYFYQFCVVVTVLSAFPARAQMTPDGSSATSTSVGGDGKVTVSIAPSDASGISHNTYTDFNVSTPGVDLDNRLAHARSIINEVTSLNPTLVQGKLEVLGQSAHVYVVNPNGITVDGGSFVNTGGLVLSTGRLRFESRQVAPGVFQRNPVLDTTAGQIVIGAGGLSGAFTHLELIAKELSIQGPVENTRAGLNSSLHITAGESSVEFDASVPVANDTRVWAATTAGSANTPGVILVDLTSNAALRASKVQLAVTDQGAGVRNMGNIVSSMGNFTLSSSGELDMRGGSIDSKLDTIIQASSVIGAANGSTRFNFSAGQNVDLVADKIQLTDGSLNVGRDLPGHLTLGKSGIPATDDLILTRTSINVSGGGVGLFATGQDIRFEGTQMTVDQRVQMEGDNLFVVSSEGVHSSLMAGEYQFPTWQGVTISGSDVMSQTDLILTPIQLSVNPAAGRGAKLIALSGGLLIKPGSGDILNDGGLLQGKTRILGNPDSRGGVTIDIPGKFVNRSVSASSLAIVFSEEDDLFLSASEIVNHTGRLIANKTVNLIALLDFTNFIAKNDSPSAGVKREYSTSSGGFLFFKSKVTGFSVDYGDLVLPGQLAYVIGNEHVNITAANVYNRGGEIDANGGNLVINTGVLENSAIQTGSAWFEKKTSFFGSSSQGHSSVVLTGGTMSAAGQLNITASKWVVNQGGQLLALDDLVVTSPEVRAIALRTYSPFERTQKGGAPFRGKKFKLLGQDVGGTFVSSAGTVRLKTTQPVQIEGGIISGAMGVDASSGFSILSEPQQDSPVDPQENLGFLFNLF